VTPDEVVQALAQVAKAQPWPAGCKATRLLAEAQAAVQAGNWARARFTCAMVLGYRELTDRPGGWVPALKRVLVECYESVAEWGRQQVVPEAVTGDEDGDTWPELI